MKQAFKIISFITQFALIMILSTGACFFGGLYLDKVLGTGFISIIGFFLGAIGGCVGVWRLIKKDVLKDKR